MSSAIATFCSTSSTATPSALTPLDDLEQLQHDDRGEAEGRLVQQQEARTRHERARDRHHLLLSSGERSRRAIEPIAHRPKHRSDALSDVRLAARAPER